MTSEIAQFTAQDPIFERHRQALIAALTEMWEETLDVRRAMSPGSPVAVLNDLLKARE